MLEGKLVVGRYVTLTIPVQLANGPPVNGIQPMQTQTMHINESTRAHVFGSKTSTTGMGHIAKAHRNYQWLEWVKGMVSEVPQNGVDVLTGPMTGCFITRYTRNGVTCVGHVGTSNNSADQDSIDAKAAWNGLVAVGGTNATGFNPFRDWMGALPPPLAGEGAPKFFGLVTAAGTFHNIFTYQLQGAYNPLGQATLPTTIRIAGIQQSPNSLPNPIV